MLCINKYLSQFYYTLLTPFSLKLETNVLETPHVTSFW